MIEQINHIAQLWWSGTIAMFWQVSVLIILIGCVDLIIRRWAWPQLRYALWLMVLIKLILPPTISLSTSVTSRLQPLAKQIIAKESRQENLNITTAMILANLKASTAEPTVEAVSSYDTVTENQPAVVITGSGNVAGEPLNISHVKPVWQVYAMAVWLAGMIVLGGWLVLKLLHLRKEDHKLPTTASLPESFYEAIARCSKSLGLRRVPKVVLTRKVACPAVFGVVRPVLLMPVGYISKMTRRDTEHTLLHELAHIKRGDLWVHGFYILLQVVYWYNPLLWLVRSQMHHLRELCCDATVARLLKDRTSEYRQTLIDVARRYLTKPTEPGLGLLGLFEDSNRLLVRLNWLKKETWRYQKMKKLTIITTIVLMFAFVLPMAQGQNPQAEEPNISTEKIKEQPSQSEETSGAEQDEGEPQTQEQLLQAKQALQAQLKQLQIEKQKLQNELQVLGQARYAKDRAEEATLKAKEAKDKAIKATKEANKTKDEAAKAKASADAARKAGVDAKQWEKYAKEMEVWSQQWANSDEFKKWQKEIQQWAKEYAKAHEEAKSSDNVSISVPEVRPMPPMPAMPAMTAEIVTPNVAAMAPPAAPVAVEPVSPQAPTVVVPKVESNPTGKAIVATPAGIAGPAPVLPNVPGAKSESTPNIEIEKDKDGKYVAIKEMHFVSKVQPGSPFVIRNSLGNIILQPSKDDTCDVRAIIRGKAETAAEAQAMVEQVGMNLHSSDERYYLKPVKQDDGQWSNLSVDFTIAVPPGVQPDVKTDLGNIEMSNLEGHIKAVTDLGSIKTVNTTGEIELVTNLGDIEFIAPKDLSAKLKAETKMGSIESDLPLNIDKTDMFKRKAEGTVGTGQDSIRLTTDMGSIRIGTQSQSSSGDNPKQVILPEEVKQNSTGNLTITQSISNAGSSKIVSTVQSVKEEKQGDRYVIKRNETLATPLVPGSVLDIANEDGTITIQGSQTNQCLVNSILTIMAPSMEAARDLSKKVSLDTTAGNKKLALKAVYPRNIPPNHSHQMDLQITVPRNTSVTLHKEDGNIQIRNLEGQIEIGTEDGDILCENVMANVRLVSEDGNVNIKKCRLTNLNIKKEDGNIHCDDISGNCDISLEDGVVTISYAEAKAENCTCIVRGDDGNVKISGGTFAKCQVERESGTIDCDNVRGNLDLKLHEGQVVVDYTDNVPESCSINAQVEEGGIRLSAPGAMFPADAPFTAKRIDEGAVWTTKAGTPDGGTRTVSLRVDEGSVKVEKR